MANDFGDRKPERREIQPVKVSSANWKIHRKKHEEIAEALLSHFGAEIETQKLLILVDLQGIYLSLHRWLSDQAFPIEGGLVMSRIAFFQIFDVFERIRRKAIAASEKSSMDFEALVAEVGRANLRQDEPGKDFRVDLQNPITPGKLYQKIVPQFELFYAPAPLDEITKHLFDHAKAGSAGARTQLEKARSGILNSGHFERDYAAYDDFISKLKANREYSLSQEGFFNFYVGPKGLQYFDEKEVDTRIVIRAMDACYNYEADLLCIVSSDQDFAPLHTRAQDFGVRSFQADLAKFRPEDSIGGKLKRQLGPNFIRGQFKKDWPLKIIVEASAVTDMGLPAMYTLTRQELGALCELHNSMNNYHIRPEFKPDGSVMLKQSRP